MSEFSRRRIGLHHDFARKRPDELPAIPAAPLAAAEAAGDARPRGQALYQALNFIQMRREA